MRARFAAFLGFSVAVVFGSCRWSDVPANAVYACDRGGGCPDGYACSQGYCFLDASVAPDGGDGCTPDTAEEVCAAAGLSCGPSTLPDGCGRVISYQCGPCANGGTCWNNACCLAPSAQDYCLDAGFACGSRELQECGQSLVVSCGSCSGGQQCVSNDLGSRCAPCVPESAAEFCDRHASTCGSIMGVDNCGLERPSVNCGTCADGGCGSTAGSNLCACRLEGRHCSTGSNCCSGTCGDAGLCCSANGQTCGDDASCCSGLCVQDVCVGFTDGGRGNGR